MRERRWEFVSAAAERDFNDLPLNIRERFVLDLKAISVGSKPFSKFESLTSIGSGVIELKKNGSPAYRCVYVAKSKDVVYVLHAFTKTTNGVDRKAMATVASRYSEIPKD